MHLEKILILNNFIKSIPVSKKELVIDKIKYFHNFMINNNYDYTKLPSSFDVKELKGSTSKVFKFRVNESDRILFTYKKYIANINPSFKGELIYFTFSDHDKQDLYGDKINLSSSKVVDISINTPPASNDINNDLPNKTISYNIDLDNIISRVVDINDLTNDNFDQSGVYYLSNEQFNCLNQNSDPLFINGGAGTGKTTIGINKLATMCNVYNNIVYLTYSNYLKNEVKSQFEHLIKELDYDFKSTIEKVKFFSINKFFSDYLPNNKRLIDYYEFDEWFTKNILRSNKFSKLKLDSMTIWKEIRGVIKGIAGKNWTNKVVSLNDEISDYTIEHLFHTNLISENDNKEYNFTCNFSDIIDSLQKSGIDKDTINTDLTTIRNKLIHQIIENSKLSRKEYLELRSTFTIHSTECRELIYDIAETYTNYLDKECLIDDNDLSRHILLEICNGNIPEFDYVMIDEIQDLTEIQLLTLFLLSKSPSNFYMNGDLNQTINPTHFRLGRVESLFKTFDSKISFTNKTLSQNYRNSKTIIHIINKLFEMKHKLFKEDFDVVHCIKSTPSVASLIHSDVIDEKEMIKITIERAYCVIVVFNEEEKNLLIDKYSNTYDKETLNGKIFSITQIKGLERNFIFCYKLISNCKDIWRSMLASKSIENDINNYKYYFNMFYVAITRAKDSICFIDDADVTLYDHIGNINILPELNVTHLNIDSISNATEYLNAAYEDEKKELYESAISNYLLSNTYEGTLSSYRCKGMLEYKIGNFDKAIEYFEKSNDKLLMADCYREKKSYSLAGDYYSDSKCYDKALKMYKLSGNLPKVEKILKIIVSIKKKDIISNFSEITDRINTFVKDIS